jgi:cell wall-associated NlpC family hydrolase
MASPLAHDRAPAPLPARRRLRHGVLVLAAVLGVLVPGLPASAEPGDAPQTSDEAAALVAAKGHELEQVTERFNEAREQLRAQQAAAQQAAKQLEAARVELGKAQQGIRGVARSAFTGEGLSGFAALMTSESADEFVDRIGVLQMVAGHQNELLDRAAAAGVTAAQAQTVAQESAAAAQRTYDDVTAQQADLEAQIADYRAVYDRLSAQEQQAALAASAAAHGERASRDDRTDTEPLSTAVVASSQTAQVVVDTAMAQRGKPYVWAAAGPGSYDCSGLVQYAFAAAGIGVPHSSRMQAQMGTPVSRSELQPGDLVFFYSPVSHVGIYIGGGNMVHAPTFGDVVKVAGVDAMGGYSHAMRISG